MMLGCLISFKICIYLETRYTSATSMIFYFYNIFMATCSPVGLCVAIFTFPNVPSPKFLPIYY